MKDHEKSKPSKVKPQPESRAGGKPAPNQATAADQAREAHEAEAARNAEASIRDRMVAIGRANRQSGRQRQDS